MSQKARTPAYGAAPRFPQEALDYNDDVTVEIVEEIRQERGVDLTSDEWVVSDGFGKVIYT